jgi:hypothetical protein
VDYICVVKKAVFIIVLMMVLKPVLPVLDYIINYDHIATELCENKAKPELHCNGKCHLAKELAKASEDEKPLSEKKTTQAEREVLFCDEVITFTFSPEFPVSITKSIPEYCNSYSHLDASSFFHPPVFIS